MKKLSEKNYYDLLGISLYATNDDIEKAYEKARKIFRADSLALYSLMDVDEIEEITERIERAYKVLISSESRKLYDDSLDQVIELNRKEMNGIMPENEFENHEQEISVVDNATDVAQKEIQDMPDKSSDPESYDGKGLKDFRISKGIELESISLRTKISKRQLGFIEENNISKLPALIYMKGFIKEYAKCIGLDPDLVLENYLKINEVKKD